MRQHTFIVLNILTSASPMLFVTFQRLISFRGEYWPVWIVVYPNWPLFHGSLIKNWEKLDPLFCVWTMRWITSRGTGIVVPKRKPLPTQIAHIPISHNPFPKLNPKPNIAQKAKITHFVAVLRSRLWGSLALQSFFRRKCLYKVLHGVQVLIQSS